MIKKLIDRFDTPLHHEQIRALYRQVPFMLLGLLGVMGFVGFFFWNSVDRQVLISWLLINLLLTVARVLLFKLFQRLQPKGRVVVKWGLLFALSSVLSGIIWGMIVFVFMNLDDVMSVLLVVLVITSISSASLVALSVFLPAFFGFSLPILLPLVITLINQPEDVFTLMGYLIVVFVVANVGFSFIVNRNISESIRLRFENLGMLENLRVQKNIAEKANTDKSRFLAATSHDLRQPLHAMDLYLGALKNLLTSEEQTQLLDKSLQSSAALSELLAALMDVSRLDAGDVMVDRRAVNIDALMQAICDEYREEASQQGISFAFQSSNLLVDSDVLMLGRMLRNLVNNACTHSAGSKISLKAEKMDEQVYVTVYDNGRGIPEEELQQVFSEFYQLSNPERDRNKGLGLGLAIVKRLANLLHHDLQLESAVGEGCYFKLCLPYAGVATGLDLDISEQEEMDVSGLFVILIDDEAEIRNAMRTLLLQWGCELLVADGLYSLQQELEAQNYPKPDVLLCDYRLRENQTGFGVVAAMRKHFNAKLPALIISGDTDKAVEEKAIEQDCEILHKPVQPDVLRAAIHTMAGLQTTNP
jgi:two-component system, sensor histidine kinase